MPAGITLTLAAGTVVKADPGAYLEVRGSLVVSGTSASPVTFTSWRDDAIGGDSNDDGDATDPGRGDWYGIGATPPSAGQPTPKVQVTYAAVRYGSWGIDAPNATVSITNSTFTQLAGDAIAVRNAPTSPAVTGNTISSTGGTAISVTGSPVTMARLTGNKGAGNALNGVALAGDTLAVSGSLPWTGTLVPVLSGGCSSLTVPVGTTLTLNPRAVVKGRSCTSIAVQGSLVSAGTEAAPVTLTSWADDSVGGDTNGDGDASAPARGSWGGVYVGPAGGGAPNPTISVDRTTLRYADHGIDVNRATLSVTSSTFTRLSGDALTVREATGIPTVTGNTVTATGGTAITVSYSTIDLSKLSGNSGVGNAVNGVALLSDTLAASGSLPWTGTLVPVLSGGCTSLTVPVGTTLTLGAGTVVKARSCTGISVQGSLAATGTTDNPVVLTSWRDDSVGGDTNGDGTASSAAAGDWSGVSTSPAGGGQPNPSISMAGVDLRHASYGVDAPSSTVSVTGSRFASLGGDAISVRNATGTPVITGNTITSTAGTAVVVASSTIDLASLAGNTGSGNAVNGVALSNDVLAVSASLPWAGNLVPVLSGGCSSVFVPSGKTLTLNAGAVVKARSCTGIVVEGALVAAGTTTAPVTFTSWRDDSVGGDTNGNGDVDDPARGDWAGISTSVAGNGRPNPRIQVDGAVVRYASSGIDASTSTVSITGSTFTRLSGDAISVRAASGVPTVTGNTVTSTGGTAISVGSSSITLAKLNGNSGSGNAVNGVALSGDTLSTSGALPWTGTLVPVLSGGCSSLFVPSGTTLRMNAGTVVKARSCTSIGVEGSLVTAGTAARPVTLTSWLDDSVGGDTNGDGDASSPARGGWGGIYTSTAGNGRPNPVVTVAGTTMRFGSYGLDTTSATVSVSGSTFQRISGDAVRVASATGVPTITGNTVTSTGGTAIGVSSSSIDLARLDGNNGSGNALNGVALSSDTLAVSSSLPWSGTLVPVLSGGCSSLTVPTGVTLSMNPGTVVKGRSCTTIAVSGSLVASGTSTSPVVLTSWRDDTVGGDTNGDRGATSPSAGDWGGVYSSPAGNGAPNPTISITGADVRWATTGLDSSGTAATVSDSRFSSSSGDAVTVRDAVGVPTIARNTITGAGGAAITVAASSVDLGRLDGNTGSANAMNGVFLSGDTLAVSSSLPWAGNLVPVLSGGCSSLRVPTGVTMTLGAGATVKARSCSGVDVDGRLVTTGTDDSPATFTSWQDDSVAGPVATARGARAAAPAAGDWSGVRVSESGVLQLDGVALRYADTAVSAAPGAEATVRGGIRLSTIGVSATTYVDVTGVDWGDPSGPAPAGTGVPITGGGVSALPWKGWVGPTVPARTPRADPPEPDASCKKVMFLGLRGSSEAPYDSADSGYPDWQYGFGDRVWPMYQSLRDRLAEKNYDVSSQGSQGRDLKGIALRYTAMHVPYTDRGSAFGDVSLGLIYNDAAYTASIWQGVDRIGQYLDDEIARCGTSQKYVLAGYSQGALAIHIYLNRRASSSVLRQIAAVGLLADPAKNGNGAENVFTNGFTPAGAGTSIKNATGIYRKVHPIGGSSGSDGLPSAITGRTASLCHNNDIVCAPGWGSWATAHGNYDSDELGRFGRWLADRLPSLAPPA